MTESPSRVYLVGGRGTGKTTTGRLLAARIGWSFVDADDVIEAAAGMSVAGIFAAEGEPGFRDREAQALVQLSTRPRHVIATGGGIILRQASSSRLCETGLCVWLTASPETMLARIAADPATAARRPPLTPLTGLDEIRHVVATREPYYRAVADLTMSTDGQSPEAVVSAILASCSIS